MMENPSCAYFFENLHKEIVTQNINWTCDFIKLDLISMVFLIEINFPPDDAFDDVF